MESLLEFAKGPMFVFTFLFMVFGLIRQVFLQIAQLKDVFKSLSYNDFSFIKNLKLFIEWILPVGHMYRNKPVMSIGSFLFHIGLLIVPFFLLGHIDLWDRGIGVKWPGIPMQLADVLTISTIICAALLFMYRIADKSARALSSGMDYFLLIMISIPFMTGYMAVHPAFNPMSYNVVMLIHILSSETVFIMLPYSKLVHAVLFPFDRISSDIFWKMPVGAGDRVAEELHGVEAKI